MADEQKIKLNREKEKIISEKERRQDHFLENDFEKPASPEKLEKYEKTGEGFNGSADLSSEKFSDGSIVSQGIYNQRQEARKREIEKVLEKDLGDIYIGLTPEKRKQFRIVGEKTAAAINDLFNTGKLKLKKIIELIRKWLLIIPGVNRFFLEQEAKIKADEIMKIKKEGL